MIPLKNSNSCALERVVIFFWLVGTSVKKSLFEKCRNIIQFLAHYVRFFLLLHRRQLLSEIRACHKTPTVSSHAQITCPSIGVPSVSRFCIHIRNSREDERKKEPKSRKFLGAIPEEIRIVIREWQEP